MFTLHYLHYRYRYSSSYLDVYITLLTLQVQVQLNLFRCLHYITYITGTGTAQVISVLLVLGLKTKFCGLGLAIGWPWPWDYGLRGLALAKNSRPISWQSTKFTINFHRLELNDWSELYFKIHVPYLLTVGNHGLAVREKAGFHYIFIVILCIMGWPALALGLWP